MVFDVRAREAVGGKPAKTVGDVDAAAKERPEEAPFAALRPHDYRLRTWNRTPAANGRHALIINIIIIQIIFQMEESGNVKVTQCLVQ